MDEFKKLDNRDTTHVWEQMSKYPDVIKQVNELLHDKYLSVDVDATTLYMGGYEHLAKIIPLRMSVYDFGAAYGFQSWHFRKHKRYIAIQPPSFHAGELHFHTDNSIWYFGTAQEFFKQFGGESDGFAIVNAVPDPKVAELVKKHFRYCYIFYV